jgi:hypothetical protein
MGVATNNKFDSFWLIYHTRQFLFPFRQKKKNNTARKKWAISNERCGKMSLGLEV